MAKLYWRVKKDGKWTWQPASVVHQKTIEGDILVYIDTVPGGDES